MTRNQLLEEFKKMKISEQLHLLSEISMYLSLEASLKWFIKFDGDDTKEVKKYAKKVLI